MTESEASFSSPRVNPFTRPFVWHVATLLPLCSTSLVSVPSCFFPDNPRSFPSNTLDTATEFSSTKPPLSWTAWRACTATTTPPCTPFLTPEGYVRVRFYAPRIPSYFSVLGEGINIFLALFCFFLVLGKGYHRHCTEHRHYKDFALISAGTGTNQERVDSSIFPIMALDTKSLGFRV